MEQDTGKPNRLKLAMGCSFAAVVFVSLIAVAVTAAKYIGDALPSTPEPVKTDNRETRAEKPKPLTKKTKKPAVKESAPRLPAPTDTVVKTDGKLPAVERGEPLTPETAKLPETKEPEPAPIVREPVAGSWPPALAMDTKGTFVDLADYKGKVVLVDFWASWCDPWERNLPRLKEVYAKYHAQGLEIVGICLHEDSIWNSNYMRKNGMTWRQIQTSDGYESPTVMRWKVEQLPAAFIIGRDGKISQTGVAGENVARLIEVEMRR